MKITLSIAILLQVILAVVSHGLTRSIAELTAFLLAVVLAYWIKYPSAARLSQHQPSKRCCRNYRP
jgi:uncharacterized membrane protein required for colicin V production